MASALDSVQEGVQILSSEWRYLFVNTAVCRQANLRREDFLGRTMLEVFPQLARTEFLQAVGTCMTERTARKVTNEFTRSDGTKTWFELHIEPCPEGVVIFSVDVSERIELERQLRQSQKMEAIGRLAGGVAHDFNNILTAVLSFCRFVQEDIGPEHPSQPDVKQVMASAERAAALTKQLLAVSRKQVFDPEPLDLNEVLGEMREMMVRLLGEDIDLVLNPLPGLGLVRADKGCIEQIILNLAVNARDAMPRGGTITVETADVLLGTNSRGHLGAQPGHYVLMAVSDTGTGMSQDIQARLFEPFFTTKPPGKGTGLGLSTIYGIVQQLGGDIVVKSTEGAGTTFTVLIPRMGEQPELVDTAALQQALPKGSGVVLVVEDDPAVRAVLLRILRGAGYTLLEAAGPEEALALAERHTGRIDLLITDLVMPGMNGKAVADRLLATRPGLRVLFMSGYTGGPVVHDEVFDSGAPYLQKPFTPELLAAKVRSVFDGTAASARPASRTKGAVTRNNHG
ncbi:MAG: response regulator [Deltaproteobacteria bacterium]|nr:response regulator [Deltaproteobacteria bacterium]